MDYYLDESGSTGDLIKKKGFDINFGGQPYFTHCCIGIEKEEEANDFIKYLRLKYKIESSEIKSKEITFEQRGIYYETADFIIKNRIPMFCEINDKKLLISTNIVHFLIIPKVEGEDIELYDEIRRSLVDVITRMAPDECIISYAQFCFKPTRENLNRAFVTLKDYFESVPYNFDQGVTKKFIKLREEFAEQQFSQYGEDGMTLFVPIPDIDGKGKKLIILPHAFSFYHIMACINKYHVGDTSKVNLFHDTQKEFSTAIVECTKIITQHNVNEIVIDPRADYFIKEPINLSFHDSKDRMPIQLTDIVAGFMSRFAREYFVKQTKLDDLSLSTFSKLCSYNRLPHPSPLGINFCIPTFHQDILRCHFNL